jgi:hypothetical protein
MSKHARVLAAVAAVTAIVAAAVVPALSGAHPGSASTQLLRIYDKPVTTTLTTNSGHVTNRPPYPQPRPGDVLDVYSLDYAGSHLHHAARWSMSDHLRCTFGHTAPVCESDLAVAGSLLVFNGNKLAGGTGRYQGAAGRVLSNKQVSDTANDSDIVIQIKP